MNDLRIPRKTKRAPSKNPKQSIYLIARVSAEQRLMVQRAARLKGLAAGEWIRRLVLIAAKKVLQEKDLPAVLPEKYENPRKMRGE